MIFLIYIMLFSSGGPPPDIHKNESRAFFPDIFLVSIQVFILLFGGSTPKLRKLGLRGPDPRQSACAAKRSGLEGGLRVALPYYRPLVVG